MAGKENTVQCGCRRGNFKTKITPAVIYAVVQKPTITQTISFLGSWFRAS
jgi:hypothetical protein